MTTIRDDIYPNLVTDFYANATRKYQDEAIYSYVKGEPIVLDRSVIREILGIGYGRKVYRSSITRKKAIGCPVWIICRIMCTTNRQRLTARNKASSPFCLHYIHPKNWEV